MTSSWDFFEKCEMSVIYAYDRQLISSAKIFILLHSDSYRLPNLSVFRRVTTGARRFSPMMTSHDVTPRLQECSSAGACVNARKCFGRQNAPQLYGLQLKREYFFLTEITPSLTDLKKASLKLPLHCFSHNLIFTHNIASPNLHLIVLEIMKI